MANIKFGTDGWRAIVGKDFTHENVQKVTLAIAKYQYDNFGSDKKIIIGYDPRNMAREFAVFTAKILAKCGFDVVLSSQIVATPVLAYAAKYYNANAIMFTASHNPPQYLGMKFIPDYAGPATDEITKEIVKNIDADLSKYNFKPKNFKETAFDNIYFEHLKTIIDFDKIKESKIEVNYDGLHGAASALFTEILDSYGIKYTSMNLNPDPTFGGKMPEPKEKYLPELKALCKETGNIGLSNDGDGDRFGAFNEKGEFVTPNEIIAILLNHLVANKKYTGKLVKTVGASTMHDLYAKYLDIEVIETAVGFKWVGQAMRENDVIIGGEESGGLSIKGHIPEKDGIIANLLIIESMAYSNKKLFELQEELHKTVGCRFVNTRVDLELESIEEQEEIIDRFRNITEIGPLKIKNTNSLDGLKLYLDDDLSWILIRKSGTEPLLRIYFESDSNEKIEQLKESVNKITKNRH